MSSSNSSARPEFNNVVLGTERKIIFPLVVTGGIELSVPQRAICVAITEKYLSYVDQDPAFSIFPALENEFDLYFCVDLSDKSTDFWEEYRETLGTLQCELEAEWASQRLEDVGKEKETDQDLPPDLGPDIGNPEYDEAARCVLNIIQLLKNAQNPFEVIFDVYGEDENLEEAGMFYIERSSFLMKEPSEVCSYYEQLLLAEDMTPLLACIDDPQQMAIQHLTFAVRQVLKYKENFQRDFGVDEEFCFSYRDMLENLHWIKDQAMLDLERRHDIKNLTGIKGGRTAAEQKIFDLFGGKP